MSATSMVFFRFTEAEIAEMRRKSVVANVRVQEFADLLRGAPHFIDTDASRLRKDWIGFFPALEIDPSLFRELGISPPRFYKWVDICQVLCMWFAGEDVRLIILRAPHELPTLICRPNRKVQLSKSSIRRFIRIAACLVANLQKTRLYCP